MANTAINFRMKRVRQSTALKYRIMVEDISEEEFNRLKAWVIENIPTTNRLTPNYKEWSKLTFRFREEEEAMGFKLILRYDDD